ncbi:sensor histidine kinase [Cytophagales bacterium LB-30]|uniref:histidine kinase n=1 Tax=Shiella aurantiaca TaxID=3058365 RepID=A0ABT8F3R6_9BACT|nr:sensor histidine kinase [Shiella aurantiaca]MDN4165102.1 sensor histidine kinase [Shiella aurantiaca]
MKNYLLLLLLFISIHCSVAQIENGKLLISTPLASDEAIKLNGYWQFVDFNDSLATDTTFQWVPGSWDKYNTSLGNKSKLGKGHYILQIQNPKRLDSLSILLYGIYEDYSVMVNDSLIYHQTTSSHRNNKNIRKLILLPNSPVITLKIEVQNQGYYLGGINYPLKLANYSSLEKKEAQKQSFELLEMGFLIAILIFALALGILTKKKAYIALATICFIVFYRSLLVYDGTLIMYRLLPHIPFSLLKRTEFIIVFLSIYAVPMYLVELYGGIKWSFFSMVFLILLLFSVSLVTFLPPHMYGESMKVYNVSIMGSFIYAGLVTIRATHKKVQGTRVQLASLLMIYLIVQLEIFKTEGIITYSFMGSNSIQTSIVLFLFIQIILIAAKYAEAFNRLRIITDQQEYTIAKRTEEIEKLSTMKSKLISILSHDLRGTLQSIKGLIYIKINTDLNPQEEKKLNHNLLQQTESNISLLDNLLQWNIYDDKPALSYSDIPISHCVREILTLYQMQIDSKNLTVHTLVPEHLIIRSDKNILETAFRNLLSNAIKFSHPYGQIYISITCQSGLFVLKVRDTGIGIPQEFGKQILQFGTKKNRKGTNNESGSGVGLSLIYELLLKIDGKLFFESEVGKGSEFTVRIPNVQVKVQEPETPPIILHTQYSKKAG